MSQGQYDLARAAAYEALHPIARPMLRDILSENVAAAVIGRGGWGRERWESLLASEDHRCRVIRAALDGVPASASTGPLEAAVLAAAQALLAAIIDHFEIEEI